jgi:CheY-like chemotaxis protein
MERCIWVKIIFSMSITILVADDEPSLRLLVKASLAARKYTILEVANGQEALNLAKQATPDLILLDVMMPFMTGFQVCAELRKDPRTASIPVIILTAKGGQDDKDMAVSVGANHFLTKPFRPPELMGAVDYVLNLSKTS